MTSLPARDDAFDRYVAEIVKHPLLTRERERALAERYRELGDLAAAEELVVSNLRFVVKICHKYNGYGFDRLDLIQEGTIGLMLAVRKFDPARGYRLISYAVWWIKAAINSFVMRSWSLVKLGTTQVQRKLFFSLRSARNRASRDAEGDALATAALLSKQLEVPEREIAAMEGRLATRDLPLDGHSNTEERQVAPRALSSGLPSPEERAAATEEARLVRGSVDRAMGHLSERERYLVENRLMAVEPETLQRLGQRFRVSRERVRQIEGKVIGKIRAAFLSDTCPATPDAWERLSAGGGNAV